MGATRMLLLTVFCFFLPKQSDSALTAYDCSTTIITYEPEPTIYDLLPKCEDIQHSQTIHADLYKRLTSTISAYQCRVTYSQSLVDAEGTSRPVFNATEILDRDACLKAHSSKTIELMGEYIPHLNANGTTKHAISNIGADVIEGDSSVFDGKSRSYSYHRSYEIQLSRVQGTLKWHENIASFKGVDCDYDRFSCENDFYGQLFWKSKEDSEDGQRLYTGIVSLVTRKETLTRPETTYTVIKFEDNIAAIKSLDNVTDDVNMAFRTEVENVFIMPRGEVFFTPWSPVPYIQSFLGQEIIRFHESKLWENVYSEKILASPANWEGEQKMNPVDVVKRLCEAEKIKFFRYLEQCSGEVEIPRKNILCTKGVHWPQIGEHFNIGHCIETTVKLRKSDQCFKEMPVVDAQNNGMFLNPYTRRLSSHAKAIDCHSNQNNVTSTKSPVWATETQLPLDISKSASECSGLDWVKIIALVLLSIWVLAIFVRIGKFLVDLISQKKRNLSVPQKDGDIEQQRTFVAGSSLTLSAVSAMFKPPFTG